MAAFMYEQKEDKTERELPAPYLGVDPDHQQHCAARLQQDRKKFQERQKNELELREKLCDHDAHYRDWAKRLLNSAPGGLSFWRLVLGLLRLQIHFVKFGQLSGALASQPNFRRRAFLFSVKGA